LKRCHICERPVDHDRDPYYVDTDPGHYDDERGLEVAMGNHMFVRACWSCWFKWPDDHKRREGEITGLELADLVAFGLVPA
jgi:hypothetical protein